MSNLKVYEVDDGGEKVWAIADDPEKAREISREYLRGDGEGDNDGLDPEDITELPMDHKLSLLDEDSEDGAERTMTCAEWIENQGEGFLATTCY